MSLRNQENPSSVYSGGYTHKNTPLHKGVEGIVTQLVQLVGRNETLQPEVISAVDGAFATVRGLYNVPGSHFIYMVRDADVTSPSSKYSTGSQGKVKKIVTFPMSVGEGTIIRSTVFTYQNPTFPTSVTSICEYEEAADFYMFEGELSYDANSAAQNNTTPNT